MAGELTIQKRNPGNTATVNLAACPYCRGTVLVWHDYGVRCMTCGCNYVGAEASDAG